jgi:hypothetical protein
VTVLLALIAGCNPLPEIVVMTGIVQDAPRSLGAPVEGATVATTAPDLTAFASVTTGADGAFAVDVPATRGSQTRTTFRTSAPTWPIAPQWTHPAA